MIAASLAALIVGLATPATALPSVWEHWGASRQVEVHQTTEAQLVAFVLPVTVYGKAETTLGDIRIVDQAGKEAPYTIDTPQASQAEGWTGVHVFDTGFVPGRYTQAVADVGIAHTPHNLLEVVVTAADGDFLRWVAVDASDDSKTWRVVRSRAPIFRFEADGIQGKQDVSFPETRSRYLRIRILDGRKPFDINGISVSNEVVTKVKRLTLPTTVTLNLQSPLMKNWWDADTSINDAPVSAVHFEATQRAFHRLVTVSSSADGESWNNEVQGFIYRESGAEQMLVEVPNGRARYWRVTVYNGNDAPIEGLSLHLLTTPQYVVFRQEPRLSYRLLYGNSHAQAPEYDFATLTTPQQRGAASIVTLGPESANAAYTSPEPWTERHAWVLWAALLAAVIIIGTLSIRLMR